MKLVVICSYDSTFKFNNKGNMMRTILITGVSTGIGQSIAEEILKTNYPDQSTPTLFERCDRAVYQSDVEEFYKIQTLIQMQLTWHY